MKTPNNGKKSIVIIDDNRIILTFLVDYLEEEFNISAFNSGKEAIKHIELGEVDCVLTDYNMPEGISGKDLFKQVKSINPLLPIVFLSGSNKTEDRVDCIQNGAADFILKPFSPAELSARVHNAINFSVVSTS